MKFVVTLAKCGTHTLQVEANSQEEAMLKAKTAMQYTGRLKDVTYSIVEMHEIVESALNKR